MQEEGAKKVKAGLFAFFLLGWIKNFAWLQHNSFPASSTLYCMNFKKCTNSNEILFLSVQSVLQLPVLTLSWNVDAILHSDPWSKEWGVFTMQKYVPNQR